MVKVKICGITNIEDAIICQEAGADILGFIFAKSPRRINTEGATDIISKLSQDIKISTLFVNEKADVIRKITGGLPRVDFLQFHGDENPEYCRQFRGERFKIIKAVRIKDGSSLAKISDFKGVDFVLLDSFKEGYYGGTGEAFDWEVAKEAKRYQVPLFLSGGLNPDNVMEAISEVKPYGVDVSSGVEKGPGKKDPVLVKRFIERTRI